jgi:hypothetical protein
MLDEMLVGLSAHEKRYITCDHAAKVFNIKLPQAAPSAV